jgi:hypothetical protein
MHRWQRIKSDGPGWYKKCRRCGKMEDIYDGPVVMM